MMRLVTYRGLSTSPEDIFDAAQKSSNSVLRQFIANTRGDILPVLGEGYGLGAMLLEPRRRIVIHWPTVLSNIVECYIREFPGMTVLLLHFCEIIKRKSPLLYTLLQRKIGTTWSRVFNNYTHIELITYPPLSIEEEELYYQLIKNVLTRADTVASFKASFDATYSKYVTPVPRNLKSTVRAYGLDPNEVSILESKRFLDVKNQHFTLSIPKHLGGMEFPQKIEPWFYELIIAFHCRHHTFGVMSALPPKEEGGTEKLGLGIIIDLKRFSTYREPYTVLYHNKEIAEIKDMLYEKFSELMYIGGPPIFREQVSRHMSYADPDNLVYMSVNALKARCERVIHCEHMRVYRGKPKKVALKSLLKVELESPVLSDYHNQTIKIEAIRRYNKMYFKPSWEPHFDIKETLARLKPGETKEWYKHPQSDDMYFTYTYLLQDSNSPLGSSKQLRDWWEQYLDLSVIRFKTLVNVVDSSDSELCFSSVEDAVIAKYLRPKMSDRAKEALLAKLSNRTWPEIVKRASIIRKRLLNEGETDINKIPRIKYSRDLLKQLENNREG